MAVQRVLYWARTNVRLGASAAPDSEEARALFLAREELGPLLAYAPEDGEWQSVVAMRDLLQDLYSDIPPRADLQAAEVTRTYRLHCCKAACQSNYLFYLEEDVRLAVANAARLGVGLGAVCADVVESLNAILKRAYNDHTARGGGGMPGATALQREGEVVLQAWEWWFLKFDLPRGVEVGTRRGVHRRKAGVVWVEYPGNATLYEVARNLLFPTPEAAHEHLERVCKGKKAPPPFQPDLKTNP